LAHCLGLSQTEVISVNLVPEMQHWFYRFVKESSVNKNAVPAPVDVETRWLPTGSFIEMLFNENYRENFYEYRYLDTLSNASWPSCVRSRMMLYGNSGKYLQLNPAGENKFLLQHDDFTLLDSLLRYRQDSTSLTIIDTTATMVATLDSTGVLIVNYDDLSTSLSKLIYLFLKLKIYGDISRYNNLTIVSRDDTNPSPIVLENMYELFLIDEYFKTVSSRFVRNVGGCAI
jgi:hypothetical protein